MIHYKARKFILYFLSTTMIFTLSFTSVAGAFAKQPGPPTPFPGGKGGQHAVDVLGDKLPEVAVAYGLTANQLHGLFLQDHTLKVDNSLELFYEDDLFPGDAQASQAEPDSPAAAPFPTGDTFTLHSLPGANHTIYLDFDGHTTTGTTWNSAYGVDPIVSPAYDIDGNPASFSATEIERIQKTWQIVSEDFRPFNVNVTTQDPGPAALSYSGGGDTQWGARVVITDDTFANCGCGGHAYIGSFDDYQDEPVFVYNSSLTGVAEASTHEVGHAINLSHDGRDAAQEAYYWGHGSGETSWAPIMGASYNKSLSQWSKGEYYDANNGGPGGNYGNGPDDLAVIASLTNGNGFGYRPDDHGDSNAGATALSVNGNALNGSGIIGQTMDVDVFRFSTGAGSVSLSITPYRVDTMGTNLDVLARLYDSSGGLVATADPASQLAASFNQSLAAGVYYLHIDGTGTGDPFSSTPTGYTGYSSLGQYTVSGTAVDPGGNNNPPTASFTHSVTFLEGTFTDTSSDTDGVLVSWSWDFGDNNTSTVQNPSHSYASAGTYTVSLTVTDDAGASDSFSDSVTVTEPPNVPPTAGFSFSTSDLTADFNDTSTDSDGTVVSWSWNFGDGSTSTLQNPSHSYAAAGNYNVSLTVADDDGATDTTAQDVAVTEPPAFVDYTASGELLVAGTLSGDYIDTHANDGVSQSIQERESGGKPANRHTYLVHKWTFNVPAGGTATTLFANTWAPPSADGDQFEFYYSTDDTTYLRMFTVAGVSDDSTYQTFDMSGLSGTIYLQVMDTDRTSAHRDKDTLYVDHLFIRTDNTLPEPPAAPSGLSAEGVSSGQIDLNWTDNADNEQGFYIERSRDGVIWTQVGSVGLNMTAYSDTGLDPETTYFYQVQAYNNADGSAYSNLANATTPATSSMQVSDLAGSSVAVRNKWNATVIILITGSDDVTPVSGATVTGSWSAGATGTVECTTDSDGICSVTKKSIKSSVPGVTFTITGVTHAVYTYDQVSSVTSIDITQ